MTRIRNEKGTTAGMRTARSRALAAAREDYAGGRYGTEYRVQYDSVIYVVDRDGVHRVAQDPEGQVISDRRLP